MGVLHIILKLGHPKIISTQISEQKILMWFLSHNILRISIKKDMKLDKFLSLKLKKACNYFFLESTDNFAYLKCRIIIWRNYIILPYYAELQVYVAIGLVLFCSIIFSIDLKQDKHFIEIINFSILLERDLHF
jgi:hypothetical protein